MHYSFLLEAAIGGEDAIARYHRDIGMIRYVFFMVGLNGADRPFLSGQTHYKTS